MSILTLQKLDKQFGGVKAIDGVSLDIQAGSLVSLIGPNGSGKSTLVNLLTGVHRPTSGLIRIGRTKAQAAIKPFELPVLGLTRTFQEVRVFEQMTVLDNLLVVLAPRSVFKALFRLRRSLDIAKAEAVLKRVGLWEKRQALASKLSYGQRKLLEIARALLMDADVYLFDEPFAGLFPEMIKIIVGIIKELHATGKTILLIEHNMALIRELSERVIVLDAGKLLADGVPEEVLSRKDVIEAYLGE